MAHAPNSTALQKHYEQGFFDLDVTAIALREDPSANLADMDADASPALTRLVDFTRAEGAWLDNYVETLGQKSKPLLESIKQGDAAKAAKIRRRIRSYARLALIEEQKVNQAAKLTQAEFGRRKEELAKPMMLFRMIEERASALMRGGKNIKDVLDAAQDLLVPEDLHDIEEEGAAVQGSIIVDEDTGPDDQTIVTYEFAASLFMLTALEGYKIVGEDGSKQKCHLCLADSTTSAETKNKLWKPAYLKEHLASSIHSKKRTWLRRTQQLYEESNAEKYFCTYGDCKAEYKTLSRLVNHIKTSNAENESQAHDDFKRADGWYDDDWEWVVPQHYRRRRSERLAAGLVFSNEKELSRPKRVKLKKRSAASPVLLAGGPNTAYQHIQNLYGGLVKCGINIQADDQEPLAMYGGVIKLGSQIAKDTQIPKAYRGLVFPGNERQ